MDKLFIYQTIAINASAVHAECFSILSKSNSDPLDKYLESFW